MAANKPGGKRMRTRILASVALLVATGMLAGGLCATPAVAETIAPGAALPVPLQQLASIMSTAPGAELLTTLQQEPIAVPSSSVSPTVAIGDGLAALAAALRTAPIADPRQRAAANAIADVFDSPANLAAWTVLLGGSSSAFASPLTIFQTISNAIAAVGNVVYHVTIAVAGILSASKLFTDGMNYCTLHYFSDPVNFEVCAGAVSVAFVVALLELARAVAANLQADAEGIYYPCGIYTEPAPYFLYINEQCVQT